MSAAVWFAFGFTCGLPVPVAIVAVYILLAAREERKMERHNDTAPSLFDGRES